MPRHAVGLAVLGPLPLVSPPALSSWMPVKITGLPAVPLATSVPSTVSSWPPPLNFRIAPADSVHVWPIGTVSVEVTWYTPAASVPDTLPPIGVCAASGDSSHGRARTPASAGRTGLQ